MEKFVKAEMEIVAFDAEDVITTSGGNCPVNTLPIIDDPVECTQDKPWCSAEGIQW